MQVGVTVFATALGTVLAALILKVNTTDALAHIAAPASALAVIVLLAVQLHDTRRRLTAVRGDLSDSTRLAQEMTELRRSLDDTATEAVKQKAMVDGLLTIEEFAHTQCLTLCYDVSRMALAPASERSALRLTMERTLTTVALSWCQQARAAVFHYDASRKTFRAGDCQGWEGARVPELSTETSIGRRMLSMLEMNDVKWCPDVS